MIGSILLVTIPLPDIPPGKRKVREKALETRLVSYLRVKIATRSHSDHSLCWRSRPRVNKKKTRGILQLSPKYFMDYNSLRVGRAFFCKFTESVDAQLTNPRLSTDALKRKKKKAPKKASWLFGQRKTLQSFPVSREK